MKKIIFTLISFFIITVSFGQILNPVKFSYSTVKKGNNQYEVHIKTSVEPRWHIYSIYNPDGGAQATALSFSNGKALGKAKEAGKMKTVFEKEFNVNQKYFETNVDFIQTVKVVPGAKKVSGSIEYMVCNDKQCLPPKTVAFDIAL
jgi:Disulphide bond corrector protein DsbC.